MNCVIETARLRMRLHRLDDLKALTAMGADPRVFEYLSGAPSMRQETWMRLLRYAGHWATMGHGYWIVEERESVEFVGEVGSIITAGLSRPSMESRNSGGSLPHTRKERATRPKPRSPGPGNTSPSCRGTHASSYRRIALPFASGTNASSRCSRPRRT